MPKVLLLLGLLSYCLLVPFGCLLMPVPEGTVASGRKITPEEITFIERGVTLKSEVIQELGQPDMYFTDLRIIAYNGEIPTYFLPWAVPPFSFGVHRDWRPYVLLIAFDSSERISNAEMTTCCRTDSVNDQTFDSVKGYAIEWVERESLPSQKPPD